MRGKPSDLIVTDAYDWILSNRLPEREVLPTVGTVYAKDSAVARSFAFCLFACPFSALDHLHRMPYRWSRLNRSPLTTSGVALEGEWEGDEAFARFRLMNIYLVGKC